MLCPECKKENRSTANYCYFCGAKLQNPDVTSDAGNNTVSVPGAISGNVDISAEQTAPVTDSKGAKTAKRRRKTYKIIILVLACVVLLCAIIAALVLFVFQPPQLSDGELQALLPEGAEVLDSSMESFGRTQIITYRYEQKRTYCDSTMTAKLTLQYSDGSWDTSVGPEILSTIDDWKGLEGAWELNTDDPYAMNVIVKIEEVRDDAVTGTIGYTDDTSTFGGSLIDCFVMGTEAFSNSILLHGFGFFADTYLRIDRDEGMFFNSNVIPMTRQAEPSAVVEEYVDVTPAPVVVEDVYQASGEESGTTAPEPDNPLDYFITYSDTIYFTWEDIEGFDDWMCELARNGIYARSGRMFNMQELQNYYEKFSWYEPYIVPENFTEDMLNDCQQANIALILSYEDYMGY